MEVKVLELALVRSQERRAGDGKLCPKTRAKNTTAESEGH